LGHLRINQCLRGFGSSFEIAQPFPFGSGYAGLGNAMASGESIEMRGAAPAEATAAAMLGKATAAEEPE
jgi:hypothetical protein